MCEALVEHPFVLRPVLIVDHALALLGIVFPVTHIHVAVGVLPEPVPVELPIEEVALIADAAIFDKHAQAVKFAFAPFTLVVLALILPDIDAVAVEVVFCKFSFISVTSAFEDKNTEAMHDLGLIVYFYDFANVLTLGLFKSNLINTWLVEDLPYLPFFITDTHVLIIFSKYHMKFLGVEGRLLE